MNTLRFYKYACLGLLLLNSLIIAFFYISQLDAHKTPENGFKAKPHEFLELDAGQRPLFHESASAHNREMRAVISEQRELLTSYFQNLITTSKTVDQDSLLNQIEQLNRYKIEITYQHFEEVKAFLNEDQKVHFKVFLNDVLDKMLLKTKPPRHPPGNRPPPPGNSERKKTIKSL